MKKFFLLLALCSTVIFTACDTDDDHYYSPEVGYGGILSVIPLNGGETYTWNDSQVSLYEEEDGTFTLWLFDTQFVPQMPKMTMAIPHVTYAQSAAITSLLCERSVPYMGGTPYERYLVTALSGTISGYQLNVAFNCMGFRVTFVGAENRY